MNARVSPATHAESADEMPDLTYRAELRRRSSVGTSTYYEAGEFCAYTLDSLIDTVQAESRLSYESLVLNLEIVGSCRQAILDAIAHKFSRLTGPKVRVVIRNGQQSSMLENLLSRALAPGAHGTS